MYRLAPVQDEMIKRIGFRQSTHPNIPQLISQLTESQAGIFVQDQHPLLSTSNLYQSAENFDQWPYPNWIAGTYAKDVYVKHSNKIWVSDIADNTSEPGVADWTEVNNFSQYLLRVLKSSAQKTLESVFENKKLDRNTKTIFENIHLFDGSGSRHAKITKQGRFVGFMIRLQKQKHLTALIRKIGTQLSNTANFPIYVYHEGKPDPLYTTTINHLSTNGFQWSNIPDIQLPYMSSEKDSGGVFYIGYYEDDLPALTEAIRRDDYRWDRNPCDTCASSQTDKQFYQKWSAYSKWIPIEVAASKINYATKIRFENNDVSQVYDSNFGLNFHVNLKCDLTDFLIENVYLLDECYSDHICSELISTMAYTLRDSGDAKQVRDKAVYEMTRTDFDGIAPRKQRSIKALSFDLSGFNTICMPSDIRRGVRTGSFI